MKPKRIFDPTKEELTKLYQFYSCSQIGKMNGVNAETVRKRLHEHGIEPFSVGGRRAFNPSKDVLNDLYQQMSMSAIAKHFNVGETVVFKRLKEHGITLKDHENGGHRLKAGRVFSQEHKANISKANTGTKRKEKNPNWKGGVSTENFKIRNSASAKNWRKAVLEKYNHKCSACGVAQNTTCECCGTKIKLHVHHIKSFADYADLRFDVNNGEVLCPKCHYSRH